MNKNQDIEVPLINPDSNSDEEWSIRYMQNYEPKTPFYIENDEDTSQIGKGESEERIQV